MRDYSPAEVSHWWKEEVKKKVFYGLGAAIEVVVLLLWHCRRSSEILQATGTMGTRQFLSSFIWWSSCEVFSGKIISEWPRFFMYTMYIAGVGRFLYQVVMRGIISHACVHTSWDMPYLHF